MATVFLIHGYLGAGKSTHARRIAAEVGAVLISLDEWYLSLYTDGSPTIEQDYALLDRLTAQLNRHWSQVVSAGADVVLDFGFWSREARDEARALASAAGAHCRLVWVSTSSETALARCLARNRDPEASFVMDEPGFQALRSRYVPPGEDEQVAERIRT